MRVFEHLWVVIQLSWELSSSPSQVAVLASQTLDGTGPVGHKIETEGGEQGLQTLSWRTSDAAHHVLCGSNLGPRSIAQINREFWVTGVDMGLA